MRSREMRRIKTVGMGGKSLQRQSTLGAVYIGQRKDVNSCCGWRDRSCRCDEGVLLDVLGEQLDTSSLFNREAFAP